MAVDACNQFDGAFLTRHRDQVAVDARNQFEFHVDANEAVSGVETFKADADSGPDSLRCR